MPQNIFLGFLEASRCWQSLTDLSFDVGASLSQSPASSHCPWISCGAVPSLNATSCPNTAHLPFNHLVGILFDHRKKKGRSVVSDSATPWTAAHQAPLSVGFSRQEYWSGVPLPSPGDLPDPGIELRSPAMRADALPCEPPGNPPFSTLLRESQNWVWTVCVTSLADVVVCIILDAAPTYRPSFSLLQAWDP